MSDDTISRKATIDAMENVDWYHISKDGQLVHGANSDDHEPLYKAKDVYTVLNTMPSAQPETHEERTETHTCDLISRQAAIDAHYEYCNKHPNASFPVWSLKILKDLPSAQPEPCVDTIDALDESIKHFDDMAEECRRNANIEQNDYMDMRDDAAEYRQLSIWLNELKWLRERFQSQPEIVRCKDCMYWVAHDKRCVYLNHGFAPNMWCCHGRRADG